MVVGDNIEEQLAPFDENYEGIEPYLDEDFDADHEVGRALEHYNRPLEGDPEADHYITLKAKRERFADRKPEDLSDAEKIEVLEDWTGGDLRVEDGKIVRYTTWNHDGRWDWYQIGGRWRGFFKIKPTATTAVLTEPHWGETLGAPEGTVPDPMHGRADRAQIKDIDFEAMREQAEVDARLQFAELVEATKGIDPPTEGWKATLARHEAAGGTVDDARKEYNNHPWVQATREVGLYLGDPYEIFHLDKPDPLESYVAERKAGAIGTYAMVHEGQWIARGEMGWFGMSNDDLTEEEFAAKQWELIQSLPESTVLTLIDAHV